MNVKLLQPGAQFRLLGEEYELLHVNPCRAYVRLLKRERRRFVANGQPVEMDAPATGISISPGTDVDPITVSKFYKATLPNGPEGFAPGLDECELFASEAELLQSLKDTGYKKYHNPLSFCVGRRLYWKGAHEFVEVMEVALIATTPRLTPPGASMP